MSVFRITLTVQELDMSKPTGQDLLGDPAETEVGLVAAPAFRHAQGLIGEMLLDTAEEFRQASEENEGE